MLLPGPVTGSWKVFLVGGKVSTTGNGLATTEIWDGSSATPHWTEDTPMPEARTHLNLVALPDGTVLGVGGAASGQVVGPTKQAILYDPTTHTWTGMATEAMRRAYHSTALLLPDGRVLSAGDSLTGGGRTTMEIFSPPYLFKGARPVITTAPEQVAYGQAFAVGTPDAVSRAVLVAPGANTHATDTHQRLLELPIAASGDGSGITTFAPPSGGAAPPGWYMLFLLNADGVPSIAKWVHVGDVGAPPPPEPTTTTVAPTTTSTTSLGG